MELIKKKKQNFYMYTYDLKSSGPRVNWPTVNTYNIICNIIYTAIWCYRRCRVN